MEIEKQIEKQREIEKEIEKQREIEKQIEIQRQNEKQRLIEREKCVRCVQNVVVVLLIASKDNILNCWSYFTKTGIKLHQAVACHFYCFV